MVGYMYLTRNFIQVVNKGTLIKHKENGPLYTSCISHRGNSGGGIFGEDGKLLGMVCSIIVDSNTQKISHCHNSGIPTKLLANAINQYDITGGVFLLLI